MIKMFSLYKSYMVRPTIYKTITKCFVILTLLMLWDRYINGGRLSLIRDGFFIGGAFLLVMAWMSYLRLDGIKNPIPREEEPQKKQKRKKRLWTGDIADYAGEHIISFDELADDECAACSMGSSLLAGLLFLIPALAALFL